MLMVAFIPPKLSQPIAALTRECGKPKRCPWSCACWCCIPISLVRVLSPRWAKFEQGLGEPVQFSSAHITTKSHDSLSTLHIVTFDLHHSSSCVTTEETDVRAVRRITMKTNSALFGKNLTAPASHHIHGTTTLHGTANHIEVQRPRKSEWPTTLQENELQSLPATFVTKGGG